MRKFILTSILIAHVQAGPALATDNGPQATPTSSGYTCQTVDGDSWCDCSDTADCIKLDRAGKCTPPLKPETDCEGDSGCFCDWIDPKTSKQEFSELFEVRKIQAVRMKVAPASSAPTRSDLIEDQMQELTAKLANLNMPTAIATTAAQSKGFSCGADGKCNCEGIKACLSMSKAKNTCASDAYGHPIIACDKGGCICNKSSQEGTTSQTTQSTKAICNIQNIIIMNGRVFTCVKKMGTDTATTK